MAKPTHFGMTSQNWILLMVGIITITLLGMSDLGASYTTYIVGFLQGGALIDVIRTWARETVAEEAEDKEEKK